MATLTHNDIVDNCMVKAGSKVRIEDFDPGWLGPPGLADLGKRELKEKAAAFLAQTIGELAEAQELLWASDRRSVLIVLQAMDAAGKDGTIKHVMSGVNPQGCVVHSFKKPNDEELDHTFLWRCQRRMPRRGEITIFNRSYYEDVLVARVHPEVLAASKLPDGDRDKEFWKQRYDDINAMERHLSNEGTVILKFFLNISKDEQKKRFMARLDEPGKHWKFSPSDAKERGYWDDYMHAYERVLRHTSTEHAPWWVIPADRKFVARALVAAVITHAIQSLGLKYPEVTEAQEKLLVSARKQLEEE